MLITTNFYLRSFSEVTYLFLPKYLDKNMMQISNLFKKRVISSQLILISAYNANFDYYLEDSENCLDTRNGKKISPDYFITFYFQRFLKDHSLLFYMKKTFQYSTLNL